MENMGRNVLGRWADFYGSRYNCGGDIGADQGGNRIWRRTSDSGNGICTEKWRITGSTLRCAFAVWNLSGLQLLVFKKKRDTEIPFAPFLLVGYLGGILL